MVLKKAFMGLSAGFLFLGFCSSRCEAAQGGLQINGEVTSEFTRSRLSGSAKVDTNAASETVRAGALDLDMRYRPVDSAQVRTLLRFYQDWQSLTSGNGRVASVRWLSADGNLGNTFGFHAGDFRRRYTPLTLWAPEVELVQEPEIFAAGRKALMDERFLGGDERLLQGFDLDYGQDFDLPMDRVNVGLLGSRVRKAEYLDQDGAQGFGLARSDMDRFFFGMRSEVFFRRYLRLGASYHRLEDDRSTFGLFVLGPKTRQAAYGNTLNSGLSLNGADSVLSRSLALQGVDGDLDLAGLLQRPHLILGLSLDYARSSESHRLAWSFRKDTAAGAVRNIPIAVPKSGSTAAALNVLAEAGWKDSLSGNHWRVTGRYLSNAKGFLNPMAQTPTFGPSRILNTENDRGGGGNGNGGLYTSFDALYNGVYRFTPSRKALGNQQAAYTKNAYNGSIWSPEDLRAFRGDPAVQLELPSGLATPNRSGFMGGLEAEWHHAVHVDLAGTSLHEIEGETGTGPSGAALIAPPVRYSMGTVGLRVDWDRLLEWRRPFHVNGSYTVRGSTRAVTGADSVPPTVAVRLWMGGLRYQGFDKWAFLAGIQSAGISLPAPLLNPPAGDTSGANRVRHELDEMQWRLGIEYSLTKSARMTASGGLISMDIAEAASPAVAGSGGNLHFTQTLLQLVLELGF